MLWQAEWRRYCDISFSFIGIPGIFLDILTGFFFLENLLLSNNADIKLFCWRVDSRQIPSTVVIYYAVGSLITDMNI